MNNGNTSPSADVASCDHEPIHIPGLIQPHGFLLGVSPLTWRVTHASENVADFLGQPPASVLGAEVSSLLAGSADSVLREVSKDPVFEKRPLLLTSWRGSFEGAPECTLIAHRYADTIIVEGEVISGSRPMLSSAHYRLEEFLNQMESAKNAAELLSNVAVEVRRMTGFDRVLVYRFDPEWNGQVVSEDRNDALPSYLDLRFPASDIPKQARELYRINRLRLIGASDYEPVRLLAANAGAPPLDLSLSTLRSVSPVHLEYMRNMGTGSSMSISLLRGTELWGLIACHSSGPRLLPFEIRSTCELLGQVLSLQLRAREEASFLAERVELRSVLGRLMAAMSREGDFRQGLLSDVDSLLSVVNASGAAVVVADEISTVGLTPSREQIDELVKWLVDLDEKEQRDLRSHEALVDIYPPAKDFVGTGAGVLSIALSRVRHSFVLWFREEVQRTVRWGGSPQKRVEVDDRSLRLHPRKSFEAWKQIVRGRAEPWKASELETARELRAHVANIILHDAERLAALSETLARTNRELESFSYTVSHDLRAPFRHIRAYGELLKLDKARLLDDEGREYVEYILSGAAYAGRMVDNILSFSQLGRATLEISSISLDEVVSEIVSSCRDLVRGRHVEWRIQPLPAVKADPAMLRMALQNLVENAIKYSRGRDPAIISIREEASEPGEKVISVADNGVGFDMKYHHKLFGMFQRLHRWEDFEGTGIGLASVRRIVMRHGGRVWAEAEPDRGATFFLSLPVEPVGNDILYA